MQDMYGILFVFVYYELFILMTDSLNCIKVTIILCAYLEHIQHGFQGWSIIILRLRILSTQTLIIILSFPIFWIFKYEYSVIHLQSLLAFLYLSS